MIAGSSIWSTACAGSISSRPPHFIEEPAMNDAARKDVYAIGKKNPNLPFHPAVRAGDFIFVSGQVAKDAEGNMIAGTIEDETRGTIQAIGRILAEEGATL